MRSQLSGILADPLPWWFWAFASAGGAWAVAEFSEAPKRKQEIATLGGLAIGALAGFMLQPKDAASNGSKLRQPKFGLGALPFQPRVVPIQHGTAHRRSWLGR